MALLLRRDKRFADVTSRSPWRYGPICLPCCVRQRRRNPRNAFRPKGHLRPRYAVAPWRSLGERNDVTNLRKTFTLAAISGALAAAPMVLSTATAQADSVDWDAVAAC